MLLIRLDCIELITFCILISMIIDCGQSFRVSKDFSLFNHGLARSMRAIKCTISSQQPHLSTDNQQSLDSPIYTQIDGIIKENKIVLFMKGTKFTPQCGFSSNACRILNALTTQYTTVNVLENEALRDGIKKYSNWPTIPQLYIAGEFIGGSDIMLQLYNSGEMQKLILNTLSPQAAPSSGDLEQQQSENREEKNER